MIYETFNDGNVVKKKKKKNSENKKKDEKIFTSILPHASTNTVTRFYYLPELFSDI